MDGSRLVARMGLVGAAVVLGWCVWVLLIYSALAPAPLANVLTDYGNTVANVSGSQTVASAGTAAASSDR